MVFLGNEDKWYHVKVINDVDEFIVEPRKGRSITSTLILQNEFQLFTESYSYLPVEEKFFIVFYRLSFHCYFKTSFL